MNAQIEVTTHNASSPLSVLIEEVSKSFPTRSGRVDALRGVNLQVPAGSFVTIVGPSGSGKSTLLGLLAGLDEPDAGQIILLPADESAPLPQRLGSAGYMPQRDLLLPWRTALDNATVALEVAGVPRDSARRSALPLFEEFGLGGFAQSYPHQLSGGMRQRVSFLRSALLSRGLMLLDEPFGALDALTRASLQEWLLETSSRLRTTYILVTHDVDEAVLLSDRVYILSPRPGSIVGRLDVDLPRPRSLEMTGSARFGEHRSDLLHLLRKTGSLPHEEAAL
jgi:ABC-type nitrate/sulfonate/bicarbonate transport system ATPase subunit